MNVAFPRATRGKSGLRTAPSCPQGEYLWLLRLPTIIRQHVRVSPGRESYRGRQQRPCHKPGSTAALLGHEVEVVFDGLKAIDAVRAYHPRVVLLDLGLPSLDGYQVARNIRQEGFNDTVIIALSGYGQEEDRRRSREAGMDYHVTKPADVKTINELIARPIGG